MSLPMRAACALLRLRPSPFRTADTARASAAKRGTDTPAPASLRRRFEVTEATSEGRAVVTVRPHGGGTGTEILYVHGGAYIHGVIAPHWSIVGDLVRRTGATVTLPCYRLAPKATAVEELPFLRAMHDEVRQRAAGRMVLAGDSAGGGLALALSVLLRDAGASSADALLLFAPWVDATLTNPEIPQVADRDPRLAVPGLVWAGQAWAGSTPVTDPSISPLNDHLRGLPPLFVHQGEQDLLAPDTRMLAAKAAEAGTACTLRLYPDGFHVFVGVPALPESRAALAHAADVVTGRVPADG